MKHVEIDTILSSALEALYKEQLTIIRLDVAERTITTLLSTILQRYFQDHSVHAEYNRHGILPKEVEMPDADGLPTMTRVYPDIIVHQPIHDEANLLIIEAKKSTNQVSDAADLLKLNQMKHQLGYRFAAFVRLATGSEAELESVCVTWV